MDAAPSALPAPSYLVPAGESDRYFDYCLQPYEPRRSPRGKLRGESLLWHSFVAMGAPTVLFDVVRAIQAHAGRDATVFGIKHDGAGRVFWELYFYDPQKEDARVRASEIARAIAPYVRIRVPVRETTRYFMFSFDLAPELLPGGEVPALNLYMAETVAQAGRSYRVTEHDMELENFYFFLHPKTAVDEVLARIKSSVFVDYARVSLARVLPPELFSCNRVCVAKKRRSDAVYFSGIEIEQLRWFLAAHAYPPPLQDFLREHAARLDHLRFDVGVDYRMDARGALRVQKTSYYSTV